MTPTTLEGKVDDFLARNPGKQIYGAHSIEEFVAAIGSVVRVRHA